MSLATQAFGQAAGSHVAHHDFKWTTGVFCYFLERAVDMMQSGRSIPEQILVSFAEEPKLQAFMKSFLKLVWRSIHAGRIYMLACVVVLFYDYAITVDQEVNQIWKRKKNIVSYLFLINRYLPLATYLFVIISVFDSNATNYFCLHVFATLPPALIVLSEAVIGVLRMAKVRALWQNDLNKWFCLATLLVFSAQTALSIASAVAIQGVGPVFGPHTRIGCFIIFHSGSMPRIILHWFTNLVFNVMIFCFILRRALNVRRAGGDAQLADILVRDAIIFLIVLSTVKIANLIMLIIFPYWNGINWSFNHIADVILTSRLIFNLRNATREVQDQDQDESENSRKGMLRGEGPENAKSYPAGPEDVEALPSVRPIPNLKQKYSLYGKL